MGLARPALSWLRRQTLSIAGRFGLASTYIGDKNPRSSGLILRWRPDSPDMLRGAIAEVPVDGSTLRFFIDNDFDEIQSYHRRGLLYEAEEMAIIARHYRAGAFVDVGGNVGNHAVWAAKVLGAERVIVFEPDPRSARICEINLALNGCGGLVDLRRKGLSNVAGHARISEASFYNLGATRLAEADDGSLLLARGDDELLHERVGFLKIDTEGFEIKVLDGLRETIARDRPAIFVEVEQGNVAAFESFCSDAGYRVVDSYSRYEPLINVLAISADA